MLIFWSLKRAWNVADYLYEKFVELLISNNQVSTNKEPPYEQLENIQKEIRYSRVSEIRYGHLNTLVNNYSWYVQIFSVNIFTVLNIESKYRFLLSYTDFCFLVVLTKCLCHKEVPIYQCNLPTGQKYIAELTWLSFIVSKSLTKNYINIFMAIFSSFHEKNTHLL